jgi:protein O-mannosyl-transferase
VRLRFICYPIHTEAIAWVTVPDVLLTLLRLISFVFFIRRNAAPKRWQIAGHAALFLAALLTKETGAMLLPLLAGFEWLYLGRSVRQLWKNRAFYASLLGVFGIYLVLRFQALGGLAPAQGRSGWEFVSNAMALMAAYQGALIWPAGLSCYHPFERLSPLNSTVLLSLAVILSGAAAIVLLRRKLPLASFGLFFIVIPVMNLTGVGESVFGERYLYLPSVGFAWLAGLAWLGLCTKSRAMAWSATIAFLAAFGYGVIHRIPDWHDDVSLWTSALRVVPGSAMPHNNLGNALLQMPDRLPDAIAEYEAALRILPAYPAAHYNLGNALLRVPGQPPRLWVCAYQ